MLAHEREHFVGLGEQRTVGVGDDEAGPGDAELRGDAVLEVLAARQRRQPDDLGADAQRGLDGGGVHAADLAVAADAAEHRDAVDRRAAPPTPSAAVGKSCDLSTMRAVAGGRGFARGFERVDRTGAVRVRAEVAVQVGRAGEVDGHGCATRPGSCSCATRPGAGAG